MKKSRISYSTALKKLHPQFQQWHARGRRIILRIDANVPLESGKIVDDYRLLKILPTIQALRDMQATIIILTHLGRPQKKSASLSTRLLIPWFEQHALPTIFAETIEDAHTQSLKHPNKLILLENLRFFSGEKTDGTSFVRELSRLGDYYINDAFATLHRVDTSVTTLAQEFPPENRSIGLLVQQELDELNPLIKNIKEPYCVIIGGGKPATKISMLKNISSQANNILLCPALVFTFLKAQKKETGKSLYDKTALDDAQKLISDQQKKASLLFPKDYLVSKENIEGPYYITENEILTSTDIGISIGPKTISTFSRIIQESQTIFFNCGMGFLNKPHTLEATQKLLHAIAQSPAYSVVGGGESVAIARASHIDQYINFLSTGGGATLAYLANIPLPGLISIMD